MTFTIIIEKLKSRRKDLRGKKLYSITIKGVEERDKEKILSRLASYVFQGKTNTIIDPHFDSKKHELWFLLYSPFSENDIKSIINTYEKAKNFGIK